MTLSSEQKELRGLDAMVIIYSLLEQHPVSDPWVVAQEPSTGCRRFLASYRWRQPSTLKT